MHPALDWQEDDPSSALMFSPPPQPARPARPVRMPGELPMAVAAAIWRGDQLGGPVSAVLSSGFEALDAQLPGGG